MTTLVNRKRVAQLIALNADERTLVGLDRQNREEEIAVLIKAAYDEASDTARAAFMARMKPMPAAAWPWSAVQTQRPRSAVSGGQFKISTGPDLSQPGAVPALMLLIRGQVASVDPAGNELPTRGTPEAFTFESLYRALDTWDTATITRWLGPQGWSSGTNSQQAPQGQPAPAPTVPVWASTPVLVTAAALTTLTTVALMSVRGLMHEENRARQLSAQLRQED